MQTHAAPGSRSDAAKFYLAFNRNRRGVEPTGASDSPAAARYVQIDPIGIPGFGRAQELVGTTSLSSGRGMQDPLKGSKTLTIALNVPVDQRQFGLYAALMFGPATVSAANAFGFVQFETLPKDGDTVTINGTEWAFEDVGTGGEATEIGATIAATVAQLATDLTASADGGIGGASYLADGERLLVTAIATGAGGDAITLAASGDFAYVSAETLRGGGLTRHLFRSGAKALPAATLIGEHDDIPDPNSTTALLGLRGGTMEIDIADAGQVTATINMQGIDEKRLPAKHVDGYVRAMPVKRWSHLQGGILIDSACVCGELTDGRISFSNGLSADRGLCCPGDPLSGAITDASPGTVDAKFSTSARYRARNLSGAVEAGTPVKVFWQLWDRDTGARLSITMARVFFPESPRAYAAGQSVIQQLEGMASAQGGYALEMELVNDVDEY